jgi:hypothetical protein
VLRETTFPARADMNCETTVYKGFSGFEEKVFKYSDRIIAIYSFLSTYRWA